MGVVHRFDLDELNGFLEEAKECISGTAEAIEAAIYRDAHPVSTPILPLGTCCFARIVAFGLKIMACMDGRYVAMLSP